MNQDHDQGGAGDEPANRLGGPLAHRVEQRRGRALGAATAWIGSPELLTSAAIALLTFGVGLWGGGFSPKAAAVVCLGAWAVALAAAAAGSRRGTDVPAHALLAGLLLAGIAALSALSLAWSDDAGSTFTVMVKAAAYAGVFAAVVALARPGDVRHWLAGVAIGLFGIAVVAVAPRFIPALSSQVVDPIEFLASLERGRLSDPIGYWNALGATTAAAAVLMTWLGAAGVLRLSRVLATAAIPLLVLVLVLTESRGAVVATVLALLVLVVVARDRVRFVRPAIGWAAGIILAAFASSRGEFTRGVPTDAATGEGLEVLLVTLLLTLGTVLAAAALDAGSEGVAARIRAAAPKLPVDSRVLRRSAVALAALAAIVVAIVAGPGIVDDFQEPPPEGRADQSTQGIATGSGRYQLWEAGIDAFASAPLVGIGAGGFAGWWNRNGAIGSAARDAHSLPVETLAELGVLGFALLLAFGIVLVSAARARLRRAVVPRIEIGALLAVLVVTGTMATIDWTWELAAVFGPGVVAAALLCGRAAAGDGETEPLRVDRFTPGLYGVERDLAGVGWRRRGLAWGFGVVAAGAVWASTLLLATEVQLAASNASLQRGDPVAAAEQARGAARVQPWAARPRQQLARAELAAGDPLAAQRSLEEAAARAPFDPVLWRELGDLAVQLGEAARAEQELGRARSLDPRLRR